MPGIAESPMHDSVKYLKNGLEGETTSCTSTSFRELSSSRSWTACGPC